MQALIKENSELKQALRKLSGKPASIVKVGTGGVPNRPLEEKYQFTQNIPGVTDRKMPIHERYEFTGDKEQLDVTSPEVLSKSFGFMV
jgi:hypothetical protein